MTRLDVKVVPGAQRTELIGRYGEGIKVRVAAPPEGGQANQAVVELLAGALDVKASAIRIVRGPRSPKKVIEIDGLEPSDVWARLDRHTKEAST